jgi:hypothetical protein
MKRTALLTVVLAGLLVNLALTAANRFTTDEARAQERTLRVVLEDRGGGDALRKGKENLEEMLSLLKNMNNNTREITKLSTNSAPAVEAATKQELATLQQILRELQGSRRSSTRSR